MEWRREPTADAADPHGVADLLARACEASGIGQGDAPVSGTRFVTSTSEMLRVSRLIEAAALASPGPPLYVGFQRARHAEKQAALYRSIDASGTPVHAFAADGPADGVWASWTLVDTDPHALRAQWFLVRCDPADPRAVVGFQIGQPGVGGRRSWEGFTTRDHRLVVALAEHLDTLIGSRTTNG